MEATSNDGVAAGGATWAFGVADTSATASTSSFFIENLAHWTRSPLD
jgi:hypothetical protein